MPNLLDERLNKILDEINSLISFLGFKALGLVILSLIFIGLLSLCSPLDKKYNYFLGVCCGFLLAYFADIPFIKAINYLIIMLAPWCISYLVFYVAKFLKWLLSSDMKLETPKPSNPYYTIDSTRRDPIQKKKK